MNDDFVKENRAPRAYLEPRVYIPFKPVVPIPDLVSLMKSFCDHVGELTDAEREAAFFIIKAGIESQ
jgi:hypothetical protein